MAAKTKPEELVELSEATTDIVRGGLDLVLTNVQITSFKDAPKKGEERFGFNGEAEST